MNVWRSAARMDWMQQAALNALDKVSDKPEGSFFVLRIKQRKTAENNADGLIKKFELYGDDPRSQHPLKKKMAARVCTAPSLRL